MAKRFIRWILPLLVVMTIAIAFVVMALPHAGAASVKSSHTISSSTKSTTGVTPDFLWRP